MAIAASGLSDSEVARRAGVTAEWLGAVQSRTRPIKNPDPRKLLAVAQVLDVTLMWLAESLGWYADDAPDWKAALWAMKNVDDEIKRAVDRILEDAIAAQEAREKAARENAASE